MDSLVRWWPPFRYNRALQALAHRIARRTRRLVHQRVWDAAAEMSLDEARGYVRVRAESVVQYDIDLVCSRLPAALRERRGKLVDLVLTAVVDCFLADLSHAQTDKSRWGRAA
jgi:hypothetical protein